MILIFIKKSYNKIFLMRLYKMFVKLYNSLFFCKFIKKLILFFRIFIFFTNNIIEVVKIYINRYFSTILFAILLVISFLGGILI